ncbi:oxidoreductase [Mucilaginibacter dorajii]|uniref:Oxidoreductase n=1 Tax=Mucilaginibacter dorajii TaxID=692994 RepID=A0ABP7PTC0_9SPHI|nr:oxidoreductase [Mucilaginibacter dorajii]MCS3737734.1 NAD(P)-dependent dehydrogenase (short-subunit alcohol dehydrogenase family) [Mucilaginibacter dorajii]
MKNWTTNDIPSQKGKTFLITGANSGTGFGTTKALVEKGANVIMAVRNLEKGKAARAKILKEVPNAIIDLMQLDLADLASVDQFSEEFAAKYKKLDVLINNAGIAMPNERTETKQGFESHFGTNHLGHFALTGKLLPILKATPHARIVVVASFVPKYSKSVIKWDDLQHTQNFDGMTAYGQSKLANILFALELGDRLKKSNSEIITVLANPGFTKSGIQADMSLMIKILTYLIAQRVDMGMLPILRAAIDPTVKSGEFYGPLKMREMRGYPELTQIPQQGLVKADQQRLWEISEQMTQTFYNFK